LDGGFGDGGALWWYVYLVSLILPRSLCCWIYANVVFWGIGFMTFAPEWLTGNKNLDGSNPLFLWVFLVFFNMLWVFIPIYALYVAYVDIGNAFMVRDGVVAASLEKLEKERGGKKVD
jgi:hypothetical protein